MKTDETSINSRTDTNLFFSRTLYSLEKSGLWNPATT